MVSPTGQRVLRERLDTIAAGLRWVKAAAHAPAVDARAVGQLLTARTRHAAPGPGPGAEGLHRPSCSMSCATWPAMTTAPGSTGCWTGTCRTGAVKARLDGMAEDLLRR